MIQNAAARLVFNESMLHLSFGAFPLHGTARFTFGGFSTVPYRAVPNRTVPCSGKAPFISLHWLPVAARIQFKTLMLAYRTTTGSAPAYFHSLLRIYIPSRSLRSASERRLVVPSKSLSFTAPGWWNDLPTPIRSAGSLSFFKQQLKTHLFQLYLTSS